MLIFLISLIPLLVYLFLKSKKAIHILQQNWYNDDNRYLRFILNHPSKCFNYDILFIIFIGGLFVANHLLSIFFGLFYIIITLIYHKQIKQEQVKKPLAITTRVKRLIITITIMYLILIITFIITFNTDYLTYYYLYLGFMAFINYFIIMTANVINKPIEKMVALYYKTKAVNKLKSMKSLEVIGITGSYGKTSSKNILSDILNIKYNALPTPKNFNTPLGLIITINNYLDKFNEYLIAEMGAFKKGEIKELCDLVHPKYGILTKIGTAHLDSFGSQENIQVGKFELIESLPSDGVGVLNADDSLQTNYKLKNNCKILWIGIDAKDVDVWADNLKLTHTGTTFDVHFKGDKNAYSFTTKLLGKHNIYNILAALALGKYFNIEITKLIAGVKKVRSIEHRLELKKVGDINIIDDAYNSNPIGSKMALDVLKMMPGKKIIVTPGMIELASREYELNKKFGEHMVGICDEVILIGKQQTKAIYDGLIDQKYPIEHIHILNDVKDAFTLMNKLKDKETYVLLENDLPDIFNEKQVK
ncbi:MAG: UDP-N-acetylmuramoyl-tripeptide--D-alanyl-D-alanine ligase [Bacilli bacterium]